MSYVLRITEQVKKPGTHPEHSTPVSSLGYNKALRSVFFSYITQFTGNFTKSLLPSYFLPFTCATITSSFKRVH